MAKINQKLIFLILLISYISPSSSSSDVDASKPSLFGLDKLSSSSPINAHNPKESPKNTENIDEQVSQYLSEILQKISEEEVQQNNKINEDEILGGDILDELLNLNEILNLNEEIENDIYINMMDEMLVKLLSEIEEGKHEELNEKLKINQKLTNELEMNLKEIDEIIETKANEFIQQNQIINNDEEGNRIKLENQINGCSDFHSNQEKCLQMKRCNFKTNKFNNEEGGDLKDTKCVVTPFSMKKLVDTKCKFESKGNLLAIAKDLQHEGFMEYTTLNYLRGVNDVDAICRSITHSYFAAPESRDEAAVSSDKEWNSLTANEKLQQILSIADEM